MTVSKKIKAIENKIEKTNLDMIQTGIQTDFNMLQTDFGLIIFA